MTLVRSLLLVLAAVGPVVAAVPASPPASWLLDEVKTLAAPERHPANSRQIVFSSNLHDLSGRSFTLYLVNVDGSGLERVTFAESFASFPVFARDGKRLVFCSGRGAAAPRDLDVFVADWADR